MSLWIPLLPYLPSSKQGYCVILATLSWPVWKSSISDPNHSVSQDWGVRNSKAWGAAGPFPLGSQESLGSSRPCPPVPLPHPPGFSAISIVIFLSQIFKLTAT